jgi:hypothetical protein
MIRKVLLVLLGAAVAASAVAAALSRGRSGRPEANGGRERTEELRREIEAARARLRERVRTQGG